MIGQTVDTGVAGKLIITAVAPGGDKGGQGTVYLTDQLEYLIKVWNPFDPPDDPRDFQTALEDTAKRYKTYARLRFGTEPELTSLPLEYAEVDARPGYIMRRADGKEMKEAWNELAQLELLERFQIAHSLAAGLSVLHSRLVVHGDVKRDNFFFTQGLKTHSVQILDIDGGGYYGREPGTQQFPPIARATARYLAPELHTPRWAEVWHKIWKVPDRRKEPDLWSLAVLIFDIIAQDDPFSRQHFKRTDFLGDVVDWPARGQLADLRKLGLGDRLIEAFAEVFCAANRRRSDFRRPTAAHWAKVLQAEIEARCGHPTPVVHRPPAKKQPAKTGNTPNRSSQATLPRQPTPSPQQRPNLPIPISSTLEQWLNKFVALGGLIIGIVIVLILVVLAGSTASANVTSIDYAPDGSTYLTSDGNDQLTLWSAETREQVWTHSLLSEGDPPDVYRVGFSPNGETIAGGLSDGTVRVWDADSRSVLHLLEVGTGPVYDFAFSADGTQLIAGSDDGTVVVWTLNDVRAVDVYDIGSAALTVVPLGEDAVAVGGGDGAVRVWNWNTNETSLLGSHREVVSALAYSPQSQILASGSADGEIHLWNPTTGELLYTMDAHSEFIYDLAFSPDGTELASGGGDGVLTIWDPVSGERVLEDSVDNAIYSLAYSPSGDELVVGTTDSEVVQWTR